MFEKVVVGIDDYEAGRDALELANQLVSLRGNLLLVNVEVVMAASGPDSDPRWQLDDRRRGLERLASVRDDAGLDAELLTVQASSVAGGRASSPAKSRPSSPRSRPFPSTCTSAIP